MYQRPKINETEDDILKQQEEFFKSNVKSSTKLIKKTEDDKIVPNEMCAADNTNEQLANTFEAIPNYLNLGVIVEKRQSGKHVEVSFSTANKGFPQAKRRDLSMKGASGSIFSRQIKKLRREAVTDNANDVIMKDSFKEDDNSVELIGSSVLLKEDLESIHQKNLDKLNTMSKNEIIEEREQLLATTDPAIIAFLRDRRHKKQKIETRPSIAEQNKAANIEDIMIPTEILKQPNAEKWLNFDILEINKLAWMKNIDLPKLKEDGKYEARFDFDGWLLPFMKEEIDEKSRILYHHGDEAGRPGYTLQELFQLCRSSVNQQKIIALNTIANILSLAASGIYEEVIELPLEQIFYVLRFCLDDNTPAVLNASIKATRNFFYNYIDETCLDSLNGFSLGNIQPVLAIDENETEDDKTVNDQQLAETNLVKCLVRTGILIRIRYIINTVRPVMETIVYCLDILTRLARDSHFIVMQLCNCSNLLSSIINNFMPVSLQPKMDSFSYGQPLVHAVKFLKILCSRDKNIAKDLVKKYRIMDSITSYLNNKDIPINTNGLKLQTESLHLWSTLISYNLALDDFTHLEPAISLMLHYHVCNTNNSDATKFVMQAHLASLLILLGNVCKMRSVYILPFLQTFVDIAVPKWMSQLKDINELSCGKLQITSSLLFCLTQFYKQKWDNLATLLATSDDCIKSLINSKGFKSITANIKSGSNILSEFEMYKSNPNLKCVEAAVWNASEHITPILQTYSCLPFLNTLSTIIEKTNNIELKQIFLRNKTIKDYLKSVRAAKKYYMTTNWFTRIESHFIMNILKISVQIQNEIDVNVYYELAVKCLSIFNSEQKEDIEYLLKNLIFNPKFYSLEVLMENLRVQEQEDNLKVVLNNLDSIFDVYTKVLGLKKDVPSFKSSQCIDVKIGNVIPLDWIYSPIIVLYSEQQSNKVKLSEEKQIYTIKNCLRWIYLYEMYFPNLADLINPTDRYCRLVCVFLSSDNLFLNDEIHKLLELCLKHLLRVNHKLHFDRKMQGLNSFQDLYIQLLEQYQGVSYGDILFGNFILLPLAQKYNNKWKKILWSEYAGIVQIFNVTPEQTLLDLESFLNPPEEDMSLLKCYRRAIVTGSIRKQSVFYKIAEHHLNSYVSRRRQITSNK